MVHTRAIAAAAVLVLASVGPATVAATGTQEASAYSGTHVAFETESSAVTGYTVDGETVVDSVAVQSTSEARSRSGLDAGVELAAVTSFEAAGLSLDSSAESATSATVTAESGATVEAHDNDRGIMVVSAGESSQYVRANVTAEAERAGDSRVVVTDDDGTTGTFIVVGDGDVTVNDGGNVTAELAQGSKLVYRQYDGERSDSERNQEQLIADGEAVAEVYYQHAEDGTERTADVVQYGEATSVEVTERSASTLEMTVDRSRSEGKVVIVQASEAAMENAEDVQVTVDGEAAAEASSYAAVRSATDDGATSKYLVRSDSSAEATTNVVVGINHFSEREVSMQSGGDGSSDGSGGDGGTEPTATGGQPGFGVLAALGALVGAGLLARRR